jgi:hypothetical protein
VTKHFELVLESPCLLYSNRNVTSSSRYMTSGILTCFSNHFSWARCPHCLRHELSSPAQALGSWVRIPIETWISVCICYLRVVLCVCSGLATSWSPA